MRQSVDRHMAAEARRKAAEDREQRLAQVAAMCDAARRGGISTARALEEIVEIATGGVAAGKVGNETGER